MRIMKRWLALMLTVSMAFSGCSGITVFAAEDAIAVETQASGENEESFWTDEDENTVSGELPADDEFIPEDKTKKSEYNDVLSEDTDEDKDNEEINYVQDEAGESGSDAEALNEEKDAGAAGLQVDYHTPGEIKAFLEQSGAKMSDAVTYAEEPCVTAPYSAGTLSNETLASAVAMTNQIRYIAGLSYNVKLDDSYSQLSQAASLVNYVNNELSHYPDKPDDMDDDLYQLGSQGASRSNISWASWASRTLNATLVDGWMADDSAGNIPMLGHRRWVLNPSMGKIGFGAVRGGNGIYSAMYAFDMSGGSQNVFGVAWPAQNMPTDYFYSSYPWSVSVGETVDASGIQVKLTRTRDGKVWNFSNDLADGYFNVNNDGYGEKGCIIFRPNLSDISAYEAGDVFEVEITKNGEAYINYSVSFFDLSAGDDSGDSVNVSVSGVTIEDKVYDGVPISYTGTAVVKDSEGNTITDVITSHSYAGTLADGSEYAQTTQAPTQAGSYTLTFTIEENDKYTAQPSVYNFTIEKKEAAITAQSVTIKTGEQLPELSGLAYDVNGLVKGDELTALPHFRYSAENISTATAGSYDIIPYGADAGNNYSIKYVNGTLTIEAAGDNTDKQTVSISGITIKKKVYDGEPISFTGDAVVKDLEGNTITDVITSRSYQGTLADGSAYAQTTQAPTQAGSYMLTFTIAENDKYTAQPSVYKFTIEKKEVTITAWPVTVKAGGQLPELYDLAYDVDGLIKGDELTTLPQFIYSAENISATTAGSYDIIPYGADAGNNYSIIYVNGTLTVEGSGGSPSYGDSGDDSSYLEDERTDLNSVSGEIAKIKAKTYDRTTPYEPTVKVTVLENGKKKTLTEGTDYRVLYDNNLDAGTEATVIVRGNGIYKGELTKKFTISPKSVKKLKIVTGNVTAGITEADIANTSIAQPVYVYDGAKLLTRGEDYNLSLKASTAKAVTLNVTGAENSNYTGTGTAKLTIYESADGAKLINPKNVIVDGKTFNNVYETEYTGKAVKPDVTVKIGDTTLTNKEYKVAYQNNKDAGTAYVIVTGKGEYKGKAVVPFRILSKQSDLAVTNVIKDKTYNGKLQKPAVTVKAGTVKLKKGKDYTVAYADNLHAGTATITVTGKGNYIGTAAKTFNINKQEIKKVSIKGNQNGGIDIYYGKILLRDGSDYTLEYGGQKGKDKVEVTIKATDDSDFTGSVTKSVKMPLYIPVLKEAGQTIEKEVGETYQLGFEEPEFQVVNISPIEWESSKPDVVSVDENGLLTMKKTGAAVIYAYANKRKNVQQCYVVVKGEEVIPDGKNYLIFDKTPGSVDDTDDFRRYVDNAYYWGYDGVYVPAGVYRIDAVKSIYLKDNMDFVMSPGAMLVAIPNSNTNYNVLWVYKLENVTISGGTIIGERNEHGSTKGQWGHGIGVYDCTNVHIDNVDISQCWGDGIYLGASDDSDVNATNSYVTITDCNVHDNRRSNLSITAADNVTIDNCKFNYAKGTDPQYGIDIETNNKNNPNEHIRISNTEMIGNKKGSMGIITVAKDIRLENCMLSGAFYNMAGKNVVLHNTTIKGEIVDKPGSIKYE